MTLIVEPTNWSPFEFYFDFSPDDNWLILLKFVGDWETPQSILGRAFIFVLRKFSLASTLEIVLCFVCFDI